MKKRGKKEERGKRKMMKNNKEEQRNKNSKNAADGVVLNKRHSCNVDRTGIQFLEQY